CDARRRRRLLKLLLLRLNLSLFRACRSPSPRTRQEVVVKSMMFRASSISLKRCHEECEKSTGATHGRRALEPGHCDVAGGGAATGPASHKTSEIKFPV